MEWVDNCAHDLCVDTGSGFGLVDKKLAQEKTFKVMYIKPTCVKGISSQTTSEYAILSLQSGGTNVQAQALVLPDIGAGTTIGMNTIKGPKMDISTSTDKLRIRDVEVPLTYKKKADSQ